MSSHASRARSKKTRRQVTPFQERGSANLFALRSGGAAPLRAARGPHPLGFHEAHARGRRRETARPRGAQGADRTRRQARRGGGAGHRHRRRPRPDGNGGGRGGERRRRGRGRRQGRGGWPRGPARGPHPPPHPPHEGAQAPLPGSVLAPPRRSEAEALPIPAQARARRAEGGRRRRRAGTRKGGTRRAVRVRRLRRQARPAERLLLRSHPQRSKTDALRGW